MTLLLPDDLTDDALIRALTERGYVVVKSKPEQWITLNALAQSVGRRANSLCRTLKAEGPNIPGLDIERTATGRIRRVRPWPEFYQWIQTKPNAQ